MPCLPQSLSRCASPRMVRILHLRHSQRSADSPCQAAGRVSGPWLRAVHDGAHGDRSSRTLRRAAGGGGGAKVPTRCAPGRGLRGSSCSAARCGRGCWSRDLSSLQAVTGSRRSFLFVDSIAFLPLIARRRLLGFFSLKVEVLHSSRRSTETPSRSLV